MRSKLWVTEEEEEVLKKEVIHPLEEDAKGVLKAITFQEVEPGFKNLRF